MIWCITGGTGSLGQALTARLLADPRVEAIRIISRDEMKQADMRLRFPSEKLRFFLGDVRDMGRMKRAFTHADVIVHAAALKHVASGEYNPSEVVKTNIFGAQNVIEAALDNAVGRVMAISTDKAPSASTLYGSTKAVAEKLFVQANAYAGRMPTRFSAVRWGNVMGSRGSVLEIFRRCITQRESLPITDPSASRFWITMPQAVKFVTSSIDLMHGGEIFVPKLPSSTVEDLAEAVGPGRKRFYTGLRPGEKKHEVLISGDETQASTVLDLGDRYALLSAFASWKQDQHGDEMPKGFGLSSFNARRLSVDELRAMIEEVPCA